MRTDFHIKGFLAKLEYPETTEREVVFHRIGRVDFSKVSGHFGRRLPVQRFFSRDAEKLTDASGVCIERHEKLRSRHDDGVRCAERSFRSPESEVDFVPSDHPAEEHAPAFTTRAVFWSGQEIAERPPIFTSLGYPLLPLANKCIPSSFEGEIGGAEMRTEKMSADRSVFTTAPRDEREEKENVDAAIKAVPVGIESGREFALERRIPLSQARDETSWPGRLERLHHRERGTERSANLRYFSVRQDRGKESDDLLIARLGPLVDDPERVGVEIRFPMVIPQDFLEKRLYFQGCISGHGKLFPTYPMHTFVGLILALTLTNAHAQAVPGGNPQNQAPYGAPGPITHRTGPQPNRVPPAYKAPATFAPPVLGRPIPENFGTCERQIRFGGKLLPCDSPVATDADNLRPIFRNTPAALDELDTYQQNRRRVRYGAYSGTAGILVGLLSTPLAGIFTKDGVKKHSLQKSFRLAGFAVALGSIVYGITYLRANEEHLDRAIDRYNDSNPGNKIEVLFQTKF